jgi:hypothetical protein
MFDAAHMWVIPEDKSMNFRISLTSEQAAALRPLLDSGLFRHSAEEPTISGSVLIISHNDVPLLVKALTDAVATEALAA